MVRIISNSWLNDPSFREKRHAWLFFTYCSHGGWSCFYILSCILSRFCVILNRSCTYNESLSSRIAPEYFYLSKSLSRSPNYTSVGQKVCRNIIASRRPIDYSTKLHQLLNLTNYGLLATCIIFSGDISTNPGPFDLRATGKVRGISICHWNIQHLTESKFEEISISLRSHQHTTNKIDVLFLLKRFVPVKYLIHRFGRSGGGILAFVNEQHCVNFRSDLITNVNVVLWLEIFPFKLKRWLLIAGVYRPPSSSRSDDINLGKNIERGYLKNKETIILGDFNINSLDSNKFCKHNLIKTMKNLHFSQHVNQVTRPCNILEIGISKILQVI